MKKFFYLLMAAFAVLCVSSSCSKDDEGAEAKKSYQELIVGTWKLDKEYRVEEDSYNANENTIAEFKSDGKVFMSYDDGSSAVINWRVVNSTLYLEADGDKEIHTIKKMDNKEMILSHIDGSSEEILYFTRLK